MEEEEVEEEEVEEEEVEEEEEEKEEEEEEDEEEEEEEEEEEVEELEEEEQEEEEEILVRSTAWSPSYLMTAVRSRGGGGAKYWHVKISFGWLANPILLVNSFPQIPKFLL